VEELQAARDENEILRARLRELELTAERDRLVAERDRLAAERDRAMVAAKLAEVSGERDKLRRAYEALKAELYLLKQRIFVAKAERVNAQQLELQFEKKKKELQALATTLNAEEAADVAELIEQLDREKEERAEQAANNKKSRKGGTKAKGLNSLEDVDMPEERVEITDPLWEGKYDRIGFEESLRVGLRPATLVRVIIARAKYKVPESDGSIATAPMPKETLRRCVALSSLLAKVLVDKFADGLPFHRQQERFAREGFSIDRSTMCRWSEDAGCALGSIVQAMAKDAMANAQCLATDATGVAIQPTPLADGSRQACAKGHFFVVLADLDHVFFEYQAKHTSAAVCDMFQGFTRYIQADASAVYDALFRGDAKESGVEPPTEVGCWAHARRKLYEASVTTKDDRALEGLLRVRQLFEYEASWKTLPPDKRALMRQAMLGPLLADLFPWATSIYEQVREQRGPVATAFGYLVRQQEPLSTFLRDGRLRIDNNASERALRPIAVGRKNWLFFGSDDHATAGANLFSLIASCKLHGLNPETYLADVLRVLPYWPRDRHLELCPKLWAATRARLDPVELARHLGDITVPSAPTASPK